MYDISRKNYRNVSTYFLERECIAAMVINMRCNACYRSEKKTLHD